MIAISLALLTFGLLALMLLADYETRPGRRQPHTGRPSPSPVHDQGTRPSSPPAPAATSRCCSRPSAT